MVEFGNHIPIDLACDDCSRFLRRMCLFPDISTRLMPRSAALLRVLWPEFFDRGLGSGADEVELFDRNNSNDSVSRLARMSGIHDRCSHRWHFIRPCKNVEPDLVDHPIPRVEIAIFPVASNLGHVDALNAHAPK